MAKKRIILPIVFGTLAIIIGGVAIGTLVFLNMSYKAIDVEEYMTSSEKVKVNETDDYIFMDSTSIDKAIIMYGGANVEEKAYSPISRKLADAGYDVFILKTKFEFALLEMDKASCVLDKFNYEDVSLMGHSLGGVVASRYMKNSKHKINNLIYLASYSDVDLSKEDINVISVVGDKDGVINFSSIEKAKAYMPGTFNHLVIEGGNHAQFGSYGKQNKDKDASISMIEQTDIAFSFIMDHIR